MAKLPKFTTEDLTRYPDQTVFKLNKMVDLLNKLAQN